jgi:hypothetical protein
VSKKGSRVSPPHLLPRARTAQESAAEPRRSPGSRRLFTLSCLLLVVVAAILRIRAAHNDLWLDEIWSLALAHSVSSPLTIFTIHHDNNNYLNTLYLYLLPDRGNWWGYRIVSIVAGIGTVILSGLIGYRRGKTNALVLMFLTTFSYFLILYSSEARGYSMLVFFMLLSFVILDRFLEQPSIWLAAFFSFSAILAVLSHLAFIHFYLATLVWSAYRLFVQRTSFNRFAANMLSCHALPVLFFAFLYLLDIRFQTTGGGRANFSVLGCFGEAFTWACGGTGGDETALLVCIAIVSAVCLSYGIRSSRQQKVDAWIFPVSAAVAVPLLFVLAYRPIVLYVRHFIVSMVFLLVLISLCLTSLFERGRWGRAVCIFLLGGYLVANGWHTWTLFSFGRGQYSEVMRYLQENTRGNAVTVEGDHIRIALTLSFFTRESGITKKYYFKPEEWPREGPEWLIVHKESYEEPIPPASQLADPAGHRYALATIYPSAPLSGLHCFLYHKMAVGQ